METLTRDDFAKVAVTLWAIWFARRKILHEGEYQSPLSTHLFIERYLKDLAIASPSIQAETKKRANNYPKWIPPRRRRGQTTIRNGFPRAVAAQN
jgi:hypothetical protein